MKVCVTGGRNYSDAAHVAKVLDAIHARNTITLLIHGKAHGADMLADAWADRAGIARLGFGAEWDRFGNAAGPVRNRRMLRTGRPDLVVAFPGGDGTANCVGQAVMLGIEVVAVEPDVVVGAG